jgi:aryl-alcohol dehydrogenase-like predicted oxidoreductase
MEISGMDYVKPGDIVMDVSRICIGCMSFGIGERGDPYGQKLLEDIKEKCSGAIR